MKFHLTSHMKLLTFVLQNDCFKIFRKFSEKQLRKNSFLVKFIAVNLRLQQKITQHGRFFRNFDKISRAAFLRTLLSAASFVCIVYRLNRIQLTSVPLSYSVFPLHQNFKIQLRFATYTDKNIAMFAVSRTYLKTTAKPHPCIQSRFSYFLKLLVALQTQ